MKITPFYIVLNDFDRSQRGWIFLMGSHGPLDSHVTVHFLTNGSCFRESRAEQLRKLLKLK